MGVTDDHLQEVGSSGWSFARGQIFLMIICKRPNPPDDHLQMAGPSGWSFARGQILRMIICKRPDPPDDYLQGAGSHGWSFSRGRSIEKIIWSLHLAWTQRWIRMWKLWKVARYVAGHQKTKTTKNWPMSRRPIHNQINEINASHAIAWDTQLIAKTKNIQQKTLMD